MAIEGVVERDREQFGARQRLARVTLLPAWLLIGVLTVVSLVGLSVPIPFRYGVLLVTLVVLGLPHGAVDHLSVARALDVSPTLRFLASFSIVYLAIGAAYAVVWFLAPGVAFLFFIALTWFHWGQGDLYTMSTLFGGQSSRGRGLAALSILVRGGLPMLVPLLAFPERYAAVARTVVSLFDPTRADWFAPLFTTDVRLALGVAFGACTALTLVVGARAEMSRRAWRLDVGETLLLWLFFATVPPVLAIGVYFAVWHSLRHVARLVELDDIALAALDRGAVRQAGRRFARDAIPATVGALLLFGGLALAVPATPADLQAVGGLYLVLLAVLTLPHVVVVSGLDVRQGIWGERETS